MFIGHYASAIGLAALDENRKGVLTFLSLASILPDVCMLMAYQWGLRLNFHADLGMLVCLFAILLHGKIIQASKKLYTLGVIAFIMHLITDIPYMAQDSSNFYNYRTLDLFLETGLLIAASGFYMYRIQPSKRRKTGVFYLVALLLIFQVIWNFFVY